MRPLRRSSLSSEQCGIAVGSAPAYGFMILWGFMRLTMKLSAVVLVLVMAACGGDDAPSAEDAARDAQKLVPPSGDTTSSSKATTTTALPKKSSAVDLARKLGCANPELTPPSDNRLSLFPQMEGMPRPIENVECTVRGLSVNIDVYANHEELRKSMTPAARIAACSFLESFGAETVHFVQGDDFVATAMTDGQLIGTKEQAEALGAALGVEPKQIDC